MRFFYYEKMLTGGWTPRVSDTYPKKPIGGVTFGFTNIRQLEPEDMNKALAELAAKYPMNGETKFYEERVEVTEPDQFEPGVRRIDASCHIERASTSLDAILGHVFPVLDHGFVRVIDYMGNDASVVQMARVSYGEGTRNITDDRGLIRYLMRHDHTSPFEGCEIKLHVKLPIFIARQWIRHRTANVNEYSGRYSVLKNEFYLPPPERLGRQSTTNKQGTGQGYTEDEAQQLLQCLDKDAKSAFMTYGELTSEQVDLARELARINLPLSTYTEWYWKIDLHNLFHFLRLRADPHAQKEIRDYASVIGEIVRMWVPLAFEAFVDYRRDAVKFSRMEMEAITRWIAATWPTDPEFGGSPTTMLADLGASKGECDEFHAKFEDLL